MSPLDLTDEARRLVARTRQGHPPTVEHGPALTAVAVILSTVRRGGWSS